jgi:hypothetical protein
MKAEIIIERKPYSKPEVIHELELETRAGSGAGPLGGAPEPNPLDDLNP